MVDYICGDILANVAASLFARKFGKRIRELREAAGLSQERLADEAGLHRTHISLIERGRRSVRLETIERLAIALKTQPGAMMPVLKFAR
ncbi:MAG TPA: helix-turn-helix transcriptional regulator [Tepidisphaeraceae bacterium]|nr:helix-turn-helix transcriptional regulator [Tepidisphaeraceae bacterium]